MFAIKLSSSNALAINNTSPIFGCEYPFSVSSVSSGDTKELSASSRVTKELSINEDGATFKVTNLDTNPTFSVTHIKASSSQFYFNGTTSFNKKSSYIDGKFISVYKDAQGNESKKTAFTLYVESIIK